MPLLLAAEGMMQANTNNSGQYRIVSLVALALAATSLPAQQPPDTTGSPAARPAPVQRPSEPALKPPAPAARPAQVPERTITVRSFVFSGNTVFPTEVLAAEVAGYTNRAISLLEVYDAADKVAAFYHARGYTLASVVPPAQKIADGLVRLEVIEGKVGQVAVEGVRSYSTERVQRYLGEFRSGTVYRLEDLDSGLRRVNRLPGLSARAVLRPGSQFGTSDLLISADEQALAASLTGDNHGRDNIGEYRGTLAGAWNNPFGLGDQIQVIYLHSAQGLLDYGFVGYSAPIGFDGVRASVSYGGATFSAETTGGGGATVEGENETARVALDWPLVMTREDTASLSVAVTNQTSNADIQGVQLTNATDISLLEVSGLLAHTYSTLAVLQTQLTLATNFESADAADCDNNPPDDCNKQMARVELDVQYLQPLFGRLDTVLRLNGVYSPDPLPPVNPFTLGGPNSVRGYPTSELRGDRGVFASLALRYGLQVGPAQFMLRAFGDSGMVERELSTVLVTSTRDTLSSVGVGADLLAPLWGDSTLTAKINWSFPTDQHPASDGETDSRLFATVTVAY